MRAMMKSDLMTLRSSFIQLSLMSVVIAVALSIALQSTAATTAALVVMLPFLFMFSLFATDEQNDWQSYRLTLPLTRYQVVYGRYVFLALLTLGCALFVLILTLVVMAIAQAVAGTVPVGEELLFTERNITLSMAGAFFASVVAFGGMAFSIPPLLRFGMTKATRIIPVLIVLLLSFALSLFGSSGLFDGEAIGGVLVKMSNDLLTTGILLFAMICVLYIASAFLSAKLYRKKEF